MEKLLQEEVYENENVSEKSKKYLKNLLNCVDVQEVFIGDPRGYAGGKVLVISAKSREIPVGLKMEYQGYFCPEGEFTIEVCIDEQYQGAIQISDEEYNFVGFVDVN